MTPVELAFKNKAKKELAAARPVKQSRRQEPEFELQCACHEYIEFQYPKFYAFHIANERKVKKYGKKQTPIEGVRLKRMGVKKGNPDYWILHPFDRDGIRYSGTVIELKAKGKLNNTSPEQKECIRQLKLIGYYVDVVDNLEDFIAIVDKNYLSLKQNRYGTSRA